MVRRTAPPPAPQRDDTRSADERTAISSPKRRSRRFVTAGLLAALLLALAFGWRPAAEQYVRSQATAALRSRDGDRALEFLEPALRRWPNDAEWHYLAARAQRRRGDMQQAREHLAQAFEQGYPVDRLQREQWLAMAQSGQLREAEPHLAKLLMSAGDDGWEVCEAYAAGYILACRFDEAQQILEAWQRDFPEDAQPHYFEGRWLESAKATAGAANAYREALRLDPTRDDVRQRLAACLVDLHEYEEASTLLETLLKRSPDDADVLNDWAICRLEQGDADGARAAVTDALQADPQHVGARLTRARIASFDGDYEAAVKILGPLAQERPFDVETRYAHAMALQAIGRQDEAAVEFAFTAAGRQELSEVQGLLERLKPKPANADLRYQIGTTLGKYHSPVEGADWLRSALDVDPHHRPALEALIAYHEAAGHDDLAQSYRLRLPAADQVNTVGDVNTVQEPRP